MKLSPKESPGESRPKDSPKESFGPLEWTFGKVICLPRPEGIPLAWEIRIHSFGKNSSLANLPLENTKDYENVYQRGNQGIVCRDG